MRSLISADPTLLMVLTRFGISLGFGDKLVEEVCADNGLDCPTFLAVANFMSGRPADHTLIKLPTLMAYLKNAHTYFLDFVLPLVRRKLIDAIDTSRTDGLGFLILRFYDDYVTEVSRHMDAEDRRVFPYVENLLKSRPAPDSFNIGKFASHHTHIDPKLKELKDMVVRYYPEKGNDMLNSALFDIITCEHDLHMHCLVEDRLFVPAVRRLEREIEQSPAHLPADTSAHGADEPQSDAEKIATLSDREKEIIVQIAKGLSNKQIADALCLSVHTVTTHRRNISAKLQIHSMAGLTIFAIVNHLIALQDIPRPR